MGYVNIAPVIQSLEDDWHKKLGSLSNPDQRVANGQWQFFDLEEWLPKQHDAADRHSADTFMATTWGQSGSLTGSLSGGEALGEVNSPPLGLPVIVAIGANFAQNKAPYSWGTPFQTSRNNKPSAITPKASSAGSPMRQNLDATLTQYGKDPTGWANRQLASGPDIDVLTLQNGYLLLATNFCPLITFLPWQKYPPQYRANLLTLFNSGFDYLDDMLQRLLLASGVRPALYVGHGLHSDVPVLFRKWQYSHHLSPWLLTSNLGYPFPKNRAASQGSDEPPPDSGKGRKESTPFYRAPVPSAPTVDRATELEVTVK